MSLLHQKLDTFSRGSIGQPGLVFVHSHSAREAPIHQARSPSRPVRVPLFSAFAGACGDHVAESSIWDWRDLPSVLDDKDDQTYEPIGDADIDDYPHSVDSGVAPVMSGPRVDALAVLFRRLSLSETPLIFPYDLPDRRHPIPSSSISA